MIKKIIENKILELTFVKKEFSNEKSTKVSSIKKENSEIREDKWNIDWKYKTNEYGVLAESLDIIKSEEKWEKGMISSILRRVCRKVSTEPGSSSTDCSPCSIR